MVKSLITLAYPICFSPSNIPKHKDDSIDWRTDLNKYSWFADNPMDSFKKGVSCVLDDNIYNKKE